MSEDDYTKLFPQVQKLVGKTCTLLLGTDQHIDGGTPKQEKRVGITPKQAKALIEWLKEMGITLTFYFVKGAGLSANCSDEEYSDAGGQAIEEKDLKHLEALHVFHALKEPCSYEGQIKGPFMRIGALHTGKFEQDSGLAHILTAQNFCAVYDGSSLGGYAYKYNRSFPIPLRSSMSVFAGEIAADTVMENFKGENGKVVISGGGVVGTACLRRLMHLGHHHFAEILVVDKDQKTCERLVHEFQQNSIIKIKQADTLEDADLQDAIGLVLGAFIQGSPAPKVARVSQLAKMKDKAIVVDVSIDEGGSISSAQDDSINLEQEIENLKKNIMYVADSHMPRKYPHKASESHGRAVLPYLATMLYLAAQEGSAIGAANYITSHFVENPDDYFSALMNDLKSGMAVSGPVPVNVWTKVVKDKDHMERFLSERNIPFLVKES
jgi:alanine dehydrogenase